MKKLWCKICAKGDGEVKCEIIIDSECEEKVVVFAREENDTVKEIRRLLEQDPTELLGFSGEEIVKLKLTDLHCISIIDGKVYALCETERYLLKERLYVLEEKLPENFVKINQSCLANIKKMERFDTSISGTLKIRFKCGHTDYVSRRQLKLIKERLGI